MQLHVMGTQTQMSSLSSSMSRLCTPKIDIFRSKQSNTTATPHKHEVHYYKFGFSSIFRPTTQTTGAVHVNSVQRSSPASLRGHPSYGQAEDTIFRFSETPPKGDPFAFSLFFCFFSTLLLLSA